MYDRPSQSQFEAVEALALQVLAFIASDPGRLADFVTATGTTVETLHQRAGDHDVMVASLEQILRDEATLLMFCANAGIAPQDIARAHAVLEARRGGATQP